MNRMPVIDLSATGLNIARLRVHAGLTVRDLQDVFGFGTPQAIYKWQRGETLPSLENLAALACILDVAMDDILAVECRRAGS
jgi:transcriptional regulator with XRE-family HTH domain